MTNPHKDERDILDKLDDFDGLLHSRQKDVIEEAHDEIEALRKFARQVAAAIDKETFHEVPVHITDLYFDAVRLGKLKR